MPTKPIAPKSVPRIPVEFAGKWVAWNAAHSEIIAHSNTIQALWQTVRDRGVVDPVFEKVPRADVRFVGMR